MLIDVDLSVVPPRVTMREAHDVANLKMVVNRPEHAQIQRDELIRLAGSAASDPGWVEGLDESLAKAAKYGWVTEEGIRTHVEWTS
ncbi:hypothetical protein [Nocardia sp. R7R-8]|uniref:hypothetical protein n=1 Tax=Nocardia sp. R7R-8 TaxID=3459304 RepID=UPI00403E02E9